ncbi:MAG: C25 family cysteine peptidase [Bacteroidota bacterium]
MKRLLVIPPRCVLVILLALVPVAQLSGQGRASIVSSTSHELVIDYFPSSYRPSEILLEGMLHSYFSESEVSSSPGTPGLPQESFVVGIPPTGSVTLSVVRDQVHVMSISPVAPVASQEIVNDPVPRVRRAHGNAQVASSNAFTEAVELAGTYWLRDQRVAVIRVNPIRYRNSNNLITSTSIRISVAIEEPAPSVPPPDPLFESVYSDVLVNYEQARAWRVRSRGTISLSQDPLADWFTPGGEYLKISVARDGIVHVPFELVQAIVPAGLDPRLFDLFYKGESVPFRVIGEDDGIFAMGDTLELWGIRLLDSAGQRDEYSDTSVYWLSLSGVGTKRTQTDTVTAGTPDLTLTKTAQRIRLEKDSIYFFGDFGLPANNQTEVVTGEGWYWRRLFAGQSTTFALNSRNFFLSGSPNFLIRGRFHSPVLNAATPNHNIEISLNNTVLGTIQFPGNTDTVFTMIAPSSLFVEGANGIRIRSIATAATVNEIYIDWLETDLLKNLTADEDTLFVIPDEGLPGQTALFQLGGFSQSDVSAYRIDSSSGMDKQFLGAISGTPGNYSITFSDTLMSGRYYVAMTGGKKRSPDILTAKTIGNLRSPGLGADYLVITGTSLKPEAERLAQYRGQRRGWRTHVALIEDIYDEFNFGHVNPAALRSFIRATDSLWIPPQPAVVVLFGDANWDFKDNLRSGKPNIVPSYGNPVSDSWFVESPDVPYLPQKQIGRIPAATSSAANDFVDMLMAYEAGGLSLWNKTFMFMASGFNATETTRFLEFSDQLLDTLMSDPIGGRASRLYKTVTNVVEFEQTEEVKRMLDDGAVWINFYGHAGTEFWGNGISSAAQLENGEGKRHLVSDISCSTVRFAEPLVDSFGERLLKAQAGGAVGYLGSSGFGYESPLRILANRLFQSVSRDTVREPGVLHLRAKITLWQSGSGSMVSQQALRQFSFLGDPSMELAIGRRPDVALDHETITIDPEIPSEADDAVVVRVPVSNFGLVEQDSLLIRWTHTLENDLPELYDIQVPFPRTRDTVTFSAPSFRRGGSHTLQILADPLNAVTEESESNNEALKLFFVTSGLLQLINPLPSSAVHPDSVVFVVQNPNIPLTSAHRLNIEIDTSDSFTSPSKVSASDIVPGFLTTSWQIPPNVLSDSSHYFWRARMYAGMDSTDWVLSWFATSVGTHPQWTQAHDRMFQRNTLSEIRVLDGIGLQRRNVPVEVLSTGFNYGNDVAVHVDGENVSMGFTNRGYNVAVMNQFSGVVESFAAFDILEGVDTVALAVYLESIPDGRIVLAAISDEGADNKTERINRAFESIGSSRIRSVTFRASWAIVGRKSAPIGSVPEELQASGIAITIRDTIDAASISGSVLTESIGPAERWSGLSWEIDTLDGFTHASVHLIRTFVTGVVDTLSDVDPTVGPISSILPDDVKSIRLRATLGADSAGFTPTLRRWSARFDPPAELTLNSQTVSLDLDSVLEGESVTVAGNIHNIGPSPAESVVVAFSILGSTGYSEISRTVILSIAPRGSASFIPSVVPTGGRPLNSAVLVFIDPDKNQRERFITNNAISLPITILRDTTSPLFDVHFDGVRILDQDYVRPEPEIRIGIRDNSPLPITDPNSVVLRLNNRRIALGLEPDSLFETLSGSEKARVTFRPTLAKGNHLLSVQVLDASGNPADSMEYEIRFKVETDLRLLQVFNFPNPFSSETAFTFHLTGLGIPDEVSLRIYTIAGRMVYERKLFPGEVNIGFNRISWDGRDQNGDAVANGVYFYKLSAVQNGKKVEVVEKMARVR